MRDLVLRNRNRSLITDGQLWFRQEFQKQAVEVGKRKNVPGIPMWTKAKPGVQGRKWDKGTARHP